MTPPSRDDLDAVVEQEVPRLGRAVAEGQLTRDAAVSALLDRVPEGLTRLGAAEMLDHWDQSLPSYSGSFENLVGPPATFSSLSPEQRLAHATKLLSVVAAADEVERLGRAVAEGCTSRADAAASLQTKLGETHTTDEMVRLIDTWGSAPLQHSRALRLLARLYVPRTGDCHDEPWASPPPVPQAE